MGHAAADSRARADDHQDPAPLDGERQSRTDRIQQAEGQIGLRVQLEGLLADETDHAEAIAPLLGR